MGEQYYAFIGAGKMATAIACGLRKSGVPADRIRAYDVSSAAAKAFTDATDVVVSETMEGALQDATVAILAVKPQFAAGALAEAKEFLEGKMLLSIAAGLTIEWLQENSGIERVIRVMPNTPALAGAGMSCYAGAKGIAVADLETAKVILTSIGKACHVTEVQMDAVTGLSGSGPAYVMEFIMGLADGGVFCGLPRATALELALQTVYGTAKMCQESSQTIGELRDAVISPAGTTARGILALQDGGFKGLSAHAVIEAAKCSAELGKRK